MRIIVEHVVEAAILFSFCEESRMRIILERNHAYAALALYTMLYVWKSRRGFCTSVLFIIYIIGIVYTQRTNIDNLLIMPSKFTISVDPL